MTEQNWMDSIKGAVRADQQGVHEVAVRWRRTHTGVWLAFVNEIRCGGVVGVRGAYSVLIRTGKVTYTERGYTSLRAAKEDWGRIYELATGCDSGW